MHQVLACDRGMKNERRTALIACHMPLFLQTLQQGEDRRSLPSRPALVQSLLNLANRSRALPPEHAQHLSFRITGVGPVCICHDFTPETEACLLDGHFLIFVSVLKTRTDCLRDL